MPKRRRLYTPNKNKLNKTNVKIKPDIKSEQEVNTARGRLMGALMDALDPADELDETYEEIPTRKERNRKKSETKEFLTDEEAKKCIRRLPYQQAYVLKLFDRSVDLSQFREDSPLYPICRAWILNQPKADYSALEEKELDEESPSGTVLPRPQGPKVSRIPELLTEQRAANKDNINLNYREAPLPTREDLLRGHLTRWTNVRRCWLDQAAKAEARYEASLKVLNQMNVEYTNAR